MIEQSGCTGCRVNVPGYYRASLACAACLGGPDPDWPETWARMGREWEETYRAAGPDLPFDIEEGK